MIQVISTADQLVSSLLGFQSIRRDGTYHLSSFSISTILDGQTLIFHNLTKEFLLINSELECINEEDYSYLQKHWFFVPTSFDEKKLAKNLSSLILPIYNRKKSNSFTILPTTKCNARCFYCFEHRIPKENMTITTAQKVASFVLKESPRGDIRIRWFGGEPLTHTEAIDTICDEIKKNSNLQLSSSIVTNGYLFDEAMVSHAINRWNLKTVQITLDGTESTYNKTKAYQYPNVNAYKTVLANLKFLSSTDLSLSLRLNIDKHNSGEMFQLIDELETVIERKDNTSIHLFPLFERAGAYPIERTESDRFSLYKSILSLKDYARKHGFSPKSSFPESYHPHLCGADSDRSIVIAPNGDLLRCEHIINQKPVGSVYDTESSIKSGVWTEYNLEYDFCSDCPIFPSCFRLKGCQENELCSPAIRQWRIEEIKRKMRNQYYLKKNS